MLLLLSPKFPAVSFRKDVGPAHFVKGTFYKHFPTIQILLVEKTVSLKILASDYLGTMAGDANIKLYVKGSVEETGQSFATQDAVELVKPVVTVTVIGAFYYTIYKHQRNTRKSFARKLHIFTRKNNMFYYPTALHRVQITPKTSTNITRYLYSRGPVKQVCLVLLAGFPAPIPFRFAYTSLTHSPQINIREIRPHEHNYLACWIINLL